MAADGRGGELLTEGEEGGRSQSDSRRTRDHLANERTFLAWKRTGFAVMALGLAIVKFGPAVGPGGHPVVSGVVLVAGGAVLLVYGLTRYRRVNDEIDNDDHTTGTQGREVTGVAGLLLGSVVAALVLLLV